MAVGSRLTNCQMFQKDSPSEWYVIANSRTARFQKLLAPIGQSTTEFAGIVYRSCTPRYATESDLLTGEGSRRHGGRWNPKGISAVYASLSPEVALAETLAHARYYRIPIHSAMPRTFVALAVELNKTLDLRDGAVRRRLGITLKQLGATDWRKEMKAGREGLTQSLGRAAFASSFECLVVPSAVAGGGNLVIFTENLGPHSAIELLNAERL